jgi:hypothetical protein
VNILRFNKSNHPIQNPSYKSRTQQPLNPRPTPTCIRKSGNRSPSGRVRSRSSFQLVLLGEAVNLIKKLTDVYSQRFRFDYRSGHEDSKEVLRYFPQSLGQMEKYYLKLCPGSFLPSPFQVMNTLNDEFLLIILYIKLQFVPHRKHITSPLQ